MFLYLIWTQKNGQKQIALEHNQKIYVMLLVGMIDQISFFGGKNKELSLSDVYFLDTNKWIWKKVITIDQPLPRFYHSGAKVKDHCVYIYGGIHVGRSSKLLSDLHIYDYSN